MKRVLAFALILFSAALCFYSCQKAPELTITSTPNIELSVDGGSGSITFTANRDWTANSSDAWVTISPSAGKASDGTVTVTVRCNANTTYDDRTATVTIRMEDLSKTVTVRQPANLGVILPKQLFNLQSDANSIDVEVQANVQYTVSSSVDWIRQTGTKGLTSKTLTFSIEENKTYDPREGKITIKPQDGSVQEQVISVKQAQRDALNVEKTSYEMPYGGGGIEVNVEANVAFDVTSSADWIHYVETKALSSSKTCLKIDENTTYSSRQGTVEIKQKNGSLKHTITIKQDGRIAVTSIELNKTNLSLRPDETATLVATVNPDNATDKTVTWTSSDSAIATVDDAGKVTSIKEGSATITAQAGEKTATCSVTVREGKKHLTFTSSGITTLSFGATGGQGSSPVFFYSYDMIEWKQWDYSALSISDTNPLYLYGDNKTGINNIDHRSWFSATGDLFSCTGDIMSLIDADDDAMSIPSDHCFSDLFGGCTLLTTSPELPATTLANGCYSEMFRDCSSLTNAPELPATTLAPYCYAYMFSGCSSLTDAPELPATTLGDGCYLEMFRDCSSLTNAPELPATTLMANCYRQMFYNCGSLTTAPELPATTLAPYCYEWMFYKCTSLTVAPGLPATTLATDCYNSMFCNCASLLAAPELPATTLAECCYYRMFDSCASLTTAPKLPATTLANSCYREMFSSCSSLTSAPKLPATALADGCYNNMFYSCTSLKSAPELPATTLAPYCYYGMFNSCTSLTTAPELSAAILAIYCYYEMFSGCSSLTNAPELPAVTLANCCYGNMFQGCFSLTNAPELPAMTLTNSCYREMFSRCTSLTSAPELPATNLASGCYLGMFNSCSSLTTVPGLPATSLASSCYHYMFYRCTSLLTAPELPATILAPYCYFGMFNSCTSLTTASELPATTLATHCYEWMFHGCTALSYIKCLATDISEICCTSGWVEFVASTGTFIKDPSMKDWPSGSSGIPEGWTVQDAE